MKWNCKIFLKFEGECYEDYDDDSDVEEESLSLERLKSFTHFSLILHFSFSPHKSLMHNAREIIGKLTIHKWKNEKITKS